MKARHRVPHLGSRLRRYDDPAHSSDPRVRAVVAGLRSVQLPAPEANFRAELRAQLVAVAPRLVEDGVAEQRQAERVVGETRAADEPGTRRRIHFGRPLAVLTTFVAVCALVLGGAVWLSRSALPGDTLYGLKRASETVQLKLDTNDTDRATDYLHFSQTRVEEAQSLLHRASASGTGLSAGGVSANTAQELTSTLKAADSQLFDGWKLLAASAASSRSSAPLSTMSDWVPGQIERLTVLRNSMPTPALRAAAFVSRQNAQLAQKLAREKAAELNKPRSASVSPTTGTRKHTSTAGGAKTGTGSAPVHSSSSKTPTANRPAPKATSATTQRTASAASPSSTQKGLLPTLIRPLDPAGTPLIGSCGLSLPGGLKVGRCTAHS